jgi:phospholipid/cholesterol/gamma-HCH transport system ATP-binding protein
MHMIGLKPPAHGDVLYEGEAFWAADDDARASLKERIGVLYQGAALWSSNTLFGVSSRS